MATHGSAFPIAKLALNNNVPPILMASLRMGMVMLLLIPFWKFKIPDKKYLKSLILFSISMGVMVYVFMNLSLKHSSFISPIIIGAQLAVPFAVLLSAKMIGESISAKKWMYVILAFVGIIIVFFDPELKNNLLGLFFASLMALFFAIAQVYSRQLKELSLIILNVYTGFFGFFVLIVVSFFVEGEVITNIKNINFESWILISYQAVIVSLFAHMSMFYLYKFYTVGQIFPFYSLFPIFGIILTFLIFGEIPSLLFFIGSFIVISSVILLQKIK
jgi:O-acetylserine/cysteine efflux transporter